MWENDFCSPDKKGRRRAEIGRIGGQVKGEGGKEVSAGRAPPDVLRASDRKGGKWGILGEGGGKEGSEMRACLLHFYLGTTSVQ